LRIGVLNCELTDKMTVSATGDIVKGELPSVEEAAEAQTQDDAPLEDAEAIVETEQPKV
jgi:hypothetical protein